MMTFSTFGLPAVGAKFLAEKDRSHHNRGQVLSTVWLFAFIFSGILSGTILLIAKFLSSKVYHNPGLLLPLTLSAGVLAFQTLQRTGLSFLQGFMNIRLMSLLRFLEAFIRSLAIGLLAYKWGLVGAVSAWLITGAVSLGITIYSVGREMKKNSVHYAWPSLVIIKQIFSFTLAAFLASILVAPLYLFGDTLLSRHYGFIPVGWISIARTLCQIILFIPIAIRAPLIPLVSKSNFEGLEKRFNQVLQLNWLVALWVTITLGVCAKWLVPLIYGEEYKDAFSVVFFYSIAVFIIAISGINSSILIGTGLIWQGFAFNLFWAILFAITAYIVIPIWGIQGLLGTYIASYLLFTIAVLIYVEKKLALHVPLLGPFILYTIIVFTAGYVVALHFEGYIYLLSVILFMSMVVVSGWFFLLPSGYRYKIEARIKNYLSVKF